MSRRPSISVNNYPEHLNPFYENDSTYQPIKDISDNKENKDTSKGSNHKFWTFGKSRKKKSSTFSIKATWNELFTKNKSRNAFADRRAGVVAGSTQNELNGRPYASSRFTHRDQIEFDEAIGTLARRRKNTYDNTRISSTCSIDRPISNPDNQNLQDRSGSEASDVTPKPPARSRFGQVSPRPTDKLPTLCYEVKEGDQSSSQKDETPLAPKRNGLRASQRLTPVQSVERKEVYNNTSKEPCFVRNDENETFSEESVFKRCHQDPVRMSNLSISSCISVTSTTSAYSRKKRRAPPPPRPKENLVPTKENEVHQTSDISKIQVNIIQSTEEAEEKKEEKIPVVNVIVNDESKPDTLNEIIATTEQFKQTEIKYTEETEQGKDESSKLLNENTSTAHSDVKIVDCNESNNEETGDNPEARRRSNGFSVQDEILKIEQQIQELQAKSSYDNKQDELNPKQSNEETRRHFFDKSVNEENGVNVELKELPRVQNECEIIHLKDTSVESNFEASIKVTELHISEPIKYKPQIVSNPLLRTKRSSSFTLEQQHSVDIESKGSKLSL